VCGKRFSHMDNLIIHIQTYHETEPMSLEEAADVFDYEKAFQPTDVNDKVKEPMYTQNCTPKFDCNKCNNGFSSEDELQEHVKANHPTFEVLCKKCERTFDNKKKLNEHMANDHAQRLNCDKHFTDQAEAEEHKTEHARYDALTTCQVCETKVNEKELSIVCDHCEFSYHKKCTELKKASGYWKPSQWKCIFCKDNQVDSEITVIVPDNSKKVPQPSRRHRKTNLNIDNPDMELYQSHIDTLKAVNAQKEAENKKLKESNDLKTKRINILEAELEQARSILILQNKCQNSEPNINQNDTSKVEN
jgi:hypothetical protein